MVFLYMLNTQVYSQLPGLNKNETPCQAAKITLFEIYFRQKPNAKFR